jgi:hypothetical protein
MRCGWGSLRTNSMTRGGTPTPALPRIRQKAGFDGQERERERNSRVAQSAHRCHRLTELVGATSASYDVEVLLRILPGMLH